MIEKIIETGNKVDFHIHSIASKHKESDDCVDLSTIDNIDLLIDKLNQREINMCSISDHDNFDFNIYNRLKQEENKGSIKKVFPAVEFSVTYDKKVLHVITIFDDKDEEKIKKIRNEIFDIKNNKPFYDDIELNSFSENKYLNILKNIDLNVVMIAHQKETLSSKETRNHDVMSLGEEKFDELVFLDYFESFEFKRKRNEIFNKNYIEKNKEKYKDITLRFVTGSDCHDWSKYPKENDDFSFTYLKCLPTFRGLAMAVTNTKRINYVNNFYSTTDKCLDSINIEIDNNEYDIKLSKGINVIIGDNSIGKSLLIHKLTNYNYLNDQKIKDSYDEYLINNKIRINSSIPESNISKFNGQGSIRKMFENKTFDSDEFLNGFFPAEPLVSKYIEIYKSEIENYISILKNKEEKSNAFNKITNFDICVIEATSKSLNFKNVTQATITSINSKIKKIGKIVEYFESINSLLDKIQENDFFDKEDEKYINDSINSNIKLISKYNNKIKQNLFEISKINIINDEFTSKDKELKKTKTDETEKIANYESNKDFFSENIVNYYYKNRNKVKYEPNIKEEKVPTTSNKVGKYRFVAKTKIKEISNTNLLTLINNVLGKSVKDINLIDSITIPDRFSNRNKDISYNDKLINLKNELDKEIDNYFSIDKAINDASDKDVTKELSSGFNSKIYFDLISNQTDDNRIYIIDQPEDDVSQPSIKKNILGDFYDMSKNRQVIIITHNPQFIVNLDVDNVIFIGKDENDKIYIQNGALEYCDKDYDILKIVADNIEGGIDSINERWKRYDKNIYDV
ncbi:putative uncharacterized protein [Clostridium sp. CAG:417]|nr:putative uncharacterized protein [Clostridium sp. CAG:417]